MSQVIVTTPMEMLKIQLQVAGAQNSGKFILPVNVVSKGFTS